ncbi:MAG: response regulator transcription factor [Flavobacteriales bacterium]|nr:response regulator transcription factor [Flavobacteriales bacterium]MCB9448955.1 response regulator transcription factor [Flavobacteriales bacterium]
MAKSPKIRILLADDQFLTRKGLAALIAEQGNLEVVGEASTTQDLYKQTLIQHPHVIIINYNDESFSLEDITGLKKIAPETHFLAITPDQSQHVLQDAIDAGINGHILKRCSREEILEAISATAVGEKFFCSKVVDTLMQPARHEPSTTKTSGATCDPVNLSERELEIIRMVAASLTNKEIADKLFISPHTVTTHRKNIMSKLGLSNTAGLVMFAVKNNIVVG